MQRLLLHRPLTLTSEHTDRSNQPGLSITFQRLDLLVLGLLDLVCDLGDDVRVALEVEDQDVVRLQVPVDDHGRVEVPEEASDHTSKHERALQISIAYHC